MCIIENKTLKVDGIASLLAYKITKALNMYTKYINDELNGHKDRGRSCFIFPHYIHACLTIVI